MLVQALIIMDFLLSLSPQSKEKLASIPVVNKSVAYLDHVLSEDDIKWTTAMKHNVTEYLKSAADGQFFLRMVETILSRDKNWVRWKIENCPLIERPAITPQDWAKAMDDAMRNNTSKKMRPNAMQPLSLDFLREVDDEEAMEELKDPKRYKLPSVKSFQRGIQAADFEIEMPDSDSSRREAIESKASQTWRALRIASRTKLALFDKIESYEDVSVLFEDPKQKEEEIQDIDGEAEGRGDGENGENGKAGGTTEAAHEGKDEPSARTIEGNGTAVEAMATD